MRVLLINPFYPISETPSPPLGLACLAGALRAAGIGVELLDFVVTPYSPSRLEAAIVGFQPQVVGVTSVTMNFFDALRVVEAVKELDGRIVTVLGGPHVTFCGPQTLTQYPAVDVVVRGEGEDTIVDLVRAIGQGKPLQRVRGIVMRSGGAIRITSERPFIEDLDRLPPPARDLIPLGRYRTLGLPISMTTSRGCPFRCIFCVGRKMVGAAIRYRRPRAVVDELAYLNSLDFHQINLADDLFTANRRHCLAVCDEILRRDLVVSWTSFARVDTVSKELLGRMKAAGCHTVSFGIESGSPDMLKRIKKGITLDQVLAAARCCSEVGITAQASFILGLPGETPQSLQQTLAFGQRLKEMGVQHGFHLLAPFPGTEIREQAERFDIRILTDDWSRYHANRAVAETAAVNRQTLDDIAIGWENEFLQWLGEIKRRMDCGTASADERWQLVKLEHTVRLYDLMMGGHLESRGHWLQERMRADNGGVEALAERLPRSPGVSCQAMAATLQYALERRSLKQLYRNGEIRWEWIDFLGIAPKRFSGNASGAGVHPSSSAP